MFNEISLSVPYLTVSKGWADLWLEIQVSDPKDIKVRNNTPKKRWVLWPRFRRFKFFQCKVRSYDLLRNMAFRLIHTHTHT